MLYLRKLRKAIERYMPDPKTIQEEQELVPGGDIRILGNAWLRKAWQKSKCTRVPREAEFRKLVRLVAEQHSLCILVKHFFLNDCIVMCLLNNLCYRYTNTFYGIAKAHGNETSMTGLSNRKPGFNLYILQPINFIGWPHKNPQLRLPDVTMWFYDIRRWASGGPHHQLWHPNHRQRYWAL